MDARRQPKGGGSVWDVVVLPWRRVDLGRCSATLAEGRSGTLWCDLGGGSVWDVVVRPWRRVGLGRCGATLAEGRSGTLWCDPALEPLRVQGEHCRRPAWTSPLKDALKEAAMDVPQGTASQGHVP